VLALCRHSVTYVESSFEYRRSNYFRDTYKLYQFISACLTVIICEFLLLIYLFEALLFLLLIYLLEALLFVAVIAALSVLVLLFMIYCSVVAV